MTRRSAMSGAMAGRSRGPADVRPRAAGMTALADSEPGPRHALAPSSGCWDIAPAASRGGFNGPVQSRLMAQSLELRIQPEALVDLAGDLRKSPSRNGD